jgi:hypothetical protein
MALELDDGAEVSLFPGDVLVENGTRHRWRVVGDAPATLAGTRWPERETVADALQGVQLATMEALARCWTTDNHYYSNE